MGGVFNPINFAVYHYAGNNPIKYIDPDGKNPVLIVLLLLDVGATITSDKTPSPQKVDTNRTMSALFSTPYTDCKSPLLLSNGAEVQRPSFQLSSNPVAALGAGLPRGDPQPADWDDDMDSNMKTVIGGLGFVGGILKDSSDGNGHRVGDIKLNLRVVNGKLVDWNVTKTEISPKGETETDVLNEDEAKKYISDHKNDENGVFNELSKILDK